MVEVSFKQIGESGAHGSRPSLIAGPIEKFEIPADVMSKHPYLKIVSAFIEWLLRTDVYTLSGYLQKPGGDLGAGLTLSLVRKKTGEIMANETIWQKDFDPAITPSKEKDPAPYYRLAEPAAIWTLFQDESVRDKLSWLSRIKRGFTFNSFNKKFALLGTSDWLSFAYFRAGVRWAREERDDKARKLYVEALNQDTNNRGARFNLGALDTEAGEYERAIDRLERARDLLKRERKDYLFCWDNISEKDKDRLRGFLVDDLDIGWAEKAEIYKSSFRQTLCICKDKDKNRCCNDKLRDSAKITLNKDEKKAILKINDAVFHTLNVIMEEKEREIFCVPKDHEWYLATYQLAVTCHYCSMPKKDEATKLRNHVSGCVDPARSKANELESKANEFQQQAEDEAMNLVATIQEAIKIQQKNENTSLRDFLESFEPLAVIMCAGILADNNEKEEARGIVENIDTTKLTYRGHYNMACYYSETKDDEKAWEHLEYALERGGDIVQWAKNDPSLEGLRKGKKCDFYELIAECSAPVTPSADLLPLAGLRLIGATYAKQLKELGIVSHNDLILKADTPEVRKKLAKKLGIDDMFLQRWALLADMMRIEGIDTQYANLLDAAGVRSLDDLKHIPNIDTLVDSLCKLNAQCLGKQLLSVEIVELWKKDAEHIDRKVNGI
jgi:tetratricopeptide (TPR) repeat protein